VVRTRNAAWFTALLGLGLLLLALSPLPVSQRLEERGSTFVTPATEGLRDVVRPLSDVLLHAGQLEELSKENAELQQEVTRLEAEAAALREGRTAAEQSAALAAAVGGDGSGHVTASVLVRDHAPGRRVLVIDRGAVDGVVLGQPVLGPGATLAGIIVEVQEHHARARLLDDTDSTVAAVDQQSRTPGALAGTEDGLRLEFVPVGAAVGRGDLLISSPLGGLLPPGILIGRVTAVHSREGDLFQTIEVEPLTDYSRLEHVLVVTDFLPSEEAPPADAQAAEGRP
jgi:rod shape-determining protein MreC